MSQPPDKPKIYHITHIDNLAGVIQDDMLLSDATMIANGGPATGIGMSKIKERRLALSVNCHPGDNVGEYVPFNFCPRSVMLIVIYYANHPELTYRGGQGPIVHLEADLRETLDWAEAAGRRWAITKTNAGAAYTDFWSDVADLHQIDWAAVAASDFRSADVQENKQAEFLMHKSFPWELVKRIGVKSLGIQTRAESQLAGAAYQPPVEIRQSWYF